MENGQDKNKKDQPIPEEELFDELDAMYQRVADIEKEDASEILTHGEAPSSSTYGARAASEEPPKKETGRNKRRSRRPIILAAIAILFALILGITFWKPITIFHLFKIGDEQQSPVPPRPAVRKPPAVVTPEPSPAPPVAPLTPSASLIPPPVAVSPAPPEPTSESVPAQTKQEAVKSPREETEKAKPMPQEIVKPRKPVPQGKYYAIQIGSFREMENVRDLIRVFNEEGLDAYWIASESKGRGAFYRVFVGKFMDADEGARFFKDKTIFKNYPDSFIREVSSSPASP